MDGKQELSIGRIATLSQLPLRDRQVFLRLDLNVPIEKGVIQDATRIEEAIPTIQYCLNEGARVLIASHLGRPKGKPNPEFSLEPVGAYLADRINGEVLLAQDCIGESVSLMAKSLKAGQVLLLENLRFHPEEEANDVDFATKLSRIADVYVSDAFGAVHRKHASTYALPQLMEMKGMGFLIEKELRYLDQLVHEPKRPFMTVLGGAKVADKIKTVEAILDRAGPEDALLVGGKMAYAFMAAQGKEIPKGAQEPAQEEVHCAEKCLDIAKRRGVSIFLPIDTIESFDVGPQTVEAFLRVLAKAKTVFWNGPLGWFEKPEYAHGTFELAKGLAELPCLKVVGGGDTVSAVKQSGVAEKFDHLSTGGGAVLEYLEGHGLPGIEILRAKRRLELRYPE